MNRPVPSYDLAEVERALQSLREQEGQCIRMENGLRMLEADLNEVNARTVPGPVEDKDILPWALQLLSCPLASIARASADRNHSAAESLKMQIAAIESQLRAVKSGIVVPKMGIKQ